MARKTIELAVVVENGNRLIAHAETREERRIVASMMESILFAADSYKGFTYRASEFLPAEEQRDGNVLKDDADDTMRHYFG